MIFIDGIVLSTTFVGEKIPELAGTRWLRYREQGDIDRDGKPVEETTVIGESLNPAWIQGSHDSKIQLKSDGKTLFMKGNPGRFGRKNNLFNLDLDGTIAAANCIAVEQGFPYNSFGRGSQLEPLKSQEAKVGPHSDKEPETAWTGSRVWSMHLTENFETGAYENVRPVIDYLDTQSVARVKKSRTGLTTVQWGSIKHCQVQVYGKADEMYDNCKTQAERCELVGDPAFRYAVEKGVIRVEVKLAYEWLHQEKLTYLGNWNMGTVERIFRDKTEVIERLKRNRFSYDDGSWLLSIPKASRKYAALWLAGMDVRPLMSKATFYRHADVLRGYGIDIMEKRNVTVLPVKMREIQIEAAEVPNWYQLGRVA
jgi:hypothetical protein